MKSVMNILLVAGLTAGVFNCAEAQGDRGNGRSSGEKAGKEIVLHSVAGTGLAGVVFLKEVIVEMVQTGSIFRQTASAMTGRSLLTGKAFVIFNHEMKFQG